MCCVYSSLHEDLFNPRDARSTQRPVWSSAPQEPSNTCRTAVAEHVTSCPLSQGYFVQCESSKDMAQMLGNHMNMNTKTQNGTNKQKQQASPGLAWLVASPAQ